MKSPRYAALSAVAASGMLIAASALTTSVLANEKYPAKPVTLIVPQPPGGDADAISRSLQPKMQEVLGQPIVIDNRAGAAGNIGTAAGAKSAPDGYTVTFVNQSTMAFNPTLYGNPGYKVDQLDPVTLLAAVNLVIVAHPSLPANNLKEYLELARKEPGKYSYGTAGNGSANHLAGEMLKTMAKVDVMHVPYKGGGPALIGVVGGEINTMVAFPLVAIPHIKSGKLKALAVTGAKRSPALPNVPTVAESGVPGYQFESWFGLVVPKGTPADIKNKIHDAAATALKTPQVQERLTASMTEPIGKAAPEFASLISRESAQWSKLIREYNVKVD